MSHVAEPAVVPAAMLGDIGASMQSARADNDRIVDFALRWLPYGGGQAEDIVVGFGISPREFYTHLDALLRGPVPPSYLDREAVDALLQVCSDRLRTVARSADQRS